MIQYFQTTTLILLWCFVLSVAWAFAFYSLISRRPMVTHPSEQPSQFVIIPSLVLGPALLVICFRFLNVNLIFPVEFFSDFWALLRAAVIPAVVLILASGLVFVLTSHIRSESQHWRAKSFSRVAEALGKDVPRSLRRLVVLKALTQAWSECLPWLFGELLVVECVFNAPGLGLDAWHLARTQDVQGLLHALFWLVVLYGVCVTVNSSVYRWIGTRLESY
jgi:ABC-type dipeptide/oligopeptide/nickel transport system permease component